jgi:hypothetical protein
MVLSHRTVRALPATIVPLTGPVSGLELSYLEADACAVLTDSSGSSSRRPISVARALHFTQDMPTPSPHDDQRWLALSNHEP